jgi:hypothetical protein
MKTIAKLMALCLLMGTLGFAQAAGAGDTKKDDAKKSDTDKPKGKKAKKAKAKKGDDKKAAAADDKGGEKK